MRINGKARMACSALLDNLTKPIRVEPLSKFPLVRDLRVDRSVLFQISKPFRLGSPSRNLRPGFWPARLPATARKTSYPLSNCISCCCCMEVCPQFNEETNFVGGSYNRPGRNSQRHPTGKVLKEERLRALRPATAAFRSAASRRTALEVCPKGIPLTNANLRPKPDGA